MKNRHVILTNKKENQSSFRRTRDVSGSQKDLETIEPKIISASQKARLNLNKSQFIQDRKSRKEKRSIDFPQNIDLIEIRFFGNFNTDLQNKYLNKYGLNSVAYKDFNKTVVFEIYDPDLFKSFTKDIDSVINSPERSSYQNQEYNLIALIYSFLFIDSKKRLKTYENKGIIINFINSANKYSEYQKDVLISFLVSNKIKASFLNDIISIEEIDNETIKFLADNFDIVIGITSSRVPVIKPGIEGPVRDYGFTVTVRGNLPIIGVIDTGVSRIDPLEAAKLPGGIDQTIYGIPFWDEEGHGTSVAGLIVLGDDFYKYQSDTYEAKARIYVIKVIQQGNNPIDIPLLIENIRKLKNDYGISIFNMSLNLERVKRYNDVVSEFAYELDRLAYELDILIFISSGNFNDQSLAELITEHHPDHGYGAFHYNPSGTSESHTCEDTNLQVPGESYNNLTIGALAGNLDEDNDNADITPSKYYPAYYSRKFHYDYTRTINTQQLNKNLRNNHLNKPDLVFDGGDYFNVNSCIEVLTDQARGFFRRTSGSSLSTPLITSYAAEILYQYSTLKSQTIKALLINSAGYYPNRALPAFSGRRDNLLKKLIGFGIPNKEKILGNSDDTITYIIEDSIRVAEIIKVPIFLPESLVASGSKLQFDVTLCFSFNPVKDNQLDYCPLHIAFNLVQNLTINEISKGILKKGKNAEDEISEEEEKLEEGKGRVPIYGLKNFGWSEDHFGVDNRLFSNSQKMHYRLQPNDFEGLGSQLAIAVRCLAKNKYSDMLKRDEHPFSLIIRITELPIAGNNSDLYNEMLAINNYLNLESSIELDGNLEAEV